MKARDTLTARRGHLLRIIVGDYIETASPVGSEHIARGHSLGVSPATIRNDMALLEEEGYITHPHTSAGRIPSDKGYRYFVRTLMEEQELPPEEAAYVRQRLWQQESEAEEWSRLAAELLARLSQAVALTTVPRASLARIKHLELVLLQEFLVLLVLVLQEARVKQQLVRWEESVTQEDLSSLARRLSRLLEGQTARQIASLPQADTVMEEQVTRITQRLMEGEDLQGAEQLHLEGLRHLLVQPEFASPERLLPLMELIEERRVLGQWLPRLAQEPGVNVVIGSENPAAELQDLTMVVASYGVPDGLTGTVGLLGPTRMRYARSISTVRYLSMMMTQLVAERYS
ncbi:MAG: heat-inducible transcription repressor HrcA [Chloroflexi bacterium]|nr:heat-inducible transcription repressor HrcA [Chloroflexota bacterium]